MNICMRQWQWSVSDVLATATAKTRFSSPPLSTVVSLPAAGSLTTPLRTQAKVRLSPSAAKISAQQPTGHWALGLL